MKKTKKIVVRDEKWHSWPMDKDLSCFQTVADNLRSEGENSRADCVEYLIERIKVVEYLIERIKVSEETLRKNRVKKINQQHIPYCLTEKGIRSLWCKEDCSHFVGINEKKQYILCNHPDNFKEKEK